MSAVCYSEDHFYFPSVQEADEDGLLLVGGKITPDRIIEGYKKGIFPWYNDDELPLWWSPDPRFVLFLNRLHQSKSMQKVFLKEDFEFKINTVFEEVITACAVIKREGQNGTWITAKMKKVYTDLYHLGYAHSAEAWFGDELVGGMYGIKIGRVFFGESMFSKKSNASKFAFIKFVQHLKQSGVVLLDCQVHTSHMESLGAGFINRTNYLLLLEQLTG
jgi:leucyl/phenylalanyl-tRNA--protein transferase